MAEASPKAEPMALPIFSSIPHSTRHWRVSLCSAPQKSSFDASKVFASPSSSSAVNMSRRPEHCFEHSLNQSTLPKQDLQAPASLQAAQGPAQSFSAQPSQAPPAAKQGSA